MPDRLCCSSWWRASQSASCSTTALCFATPHGRQQVLNALPLHCPGFTERSQKRQTRGAQAAGSEGRGRLAAAAPRPGSWVGGGRRCTGPRGGVPAAGIAAAAADASGVLRLRARARCLFASIRARCSGDAPAASARLPAYRSPPVAAVAAGVVAAVAAADVAVRLARAAGAAAAGAAAACPPARKASACWMRASSAT